MKKLFSLVAALMISGCGIVVDDYVWVNSRAAQYYQSHGFKVLGYQGYNINSIGRCYWYTVQRDQTIYDSCLVRWNNEIHEYNLRAINAVRGN